MKTTGYFQYTRQRLDRQHIKEAWITKAVTKPDAEEIQSDGRIRRWTWIPEEGKFLRVILLEMARRSTTPSSTAASRNR